MTSPKIFIDQTLKRNGDITRLCLEYDLMSEAQDACRDLDRAFPKYRHNAIKSTQMIGIKTILNEIEESV